MAKESWFKRILPYLLGGAAGGYGYKRIQAHDARQKRRAQQVHGENVREHKKAAQSFRQSEKINQALAKRNLKLLKKFGGESFQQHPRLTGQQQGLLDYLTQFGQQNTQPLGQNPLYQRATNSLMDLLSQTPEAYQRFKEPTMQEFNREIVPGLAERFAGQGGLRSSGFQNALGDAGSQLGYKLGALRAGLQQSALDRALQYSAAPGEQGMQASQLGLGTDPYINIYRSPTFAQGQIAGSPPPAPVYQRPQSTWSQLAQGFLPGVGSAAGSAIGGPIGAAAGSSISNAFKNIF